MIFQDYRYATMIKTRSVDNVPPRIERGFYISRYGKRSTNSITGKIFFIHLYAFINLFKNKYLYKQNNLLKHDIYKYEII